MHQTLVLILALSLGLLSQSANQSPAPAPGEESLKLQADLVLVDVLPVQKKTARFIGGLGRNDFTIFEDGVQQKVDYFSKDKLPVSVVLLVDRAGCVRSEERRVGK